MNVYVLDTGIRSTHSEFALYKGPPGAGSGGSNSGYSAAVPSGSTALGTSSPGYRVVRAFSAFRDGSSEDCHGHGTHVAAIVGGLTYGVAKNVTLHAVRVLGCDGRARVSDLLQVSNTTCTSCQACGGGGQAVSMPGHACVCGVIMQSAM